MALPSGLGLVLVASVFGSAALGLGLAVVGWRRRDTPGARWFTVMVLLLAGWSLGKGLLWLSPPGGTALLFDSLADGFAMCFGFALFVFVIEYTGRREWLTRRVLALIWVEPIGYVFLSLTDPWHGLVRSEVDYTTAETLTVLVEELGPVASVQLAYSYVVGTVTLFLLVRFYLRARSHREQTGVMLLAFAVGFVVNVAFFAGVSPDPNLDLTPVTLLLITVAIGWAVFRHDFLDVAPLATDLLIEEMEDPVIVLDDERRIVERNVAAAAAIPGGADGTVRLEDVSPELASALGSEERHAVTLDTVDGEERVYDVRAAPVRDQHGIRRGHLIVLRDITVLKRRERQLERQNEHLERFARVISHDLRNPLSVARGYAELAREGREGAIDTVIDALDEMDALVEDVLALAREGRTVSDPDPVSLSEAATTAWSFAEVGDAELVVEGDGTIDADAGRLRELLGNLFRNAVEHGGAGVVRVGPLDGGEPVADEAPDLDRMGGFYVEDDGAGIPEAARENVFEYGHTTADGGTGLGLSIVLAIAEAHGWTVSTTPGRDGGARFEVRDAEVGGPAAAERQTL